MYENFGDIGMNIKKMVDDFQQVAKSNQNIQTIGLYLQACIVAWVVQSVSVATRSNMVFFLPKRSFCL